LQFSFETKYAVFFFSTKLVAISRLINLKLHFGFENFFWK